LFAELRDLGFDILTYRKAPFPLEPARAFEPYVVKDAFGHEQTYLLAERSIRLYYDKKRHYFAARQVTRRDPTSGHQTPVLTTWPTTRLSTEVATSMFHRWRDENESRFDGGSVYRLRRYRISGRGARRSSTPRAQREQVPTTHGHHPGTGEEVGPRHGGIISPAAAQVVDFSLIYKDQLSPCQESWTPESRSESLARSVRRRSS
jgi:hypothetical protein